MYPTVTSIVHEKEHRLRMIMKMQGLPMNVYFLVTYLYQFCTYLLLTALMSFFGYLANVQLFRIHNFGLLFMFLFFWGHLLVMFAFLLSTFFGNERTAGAVTFLLILIFWIVGLTLIKQFLQPVLYARLFCSSTLLSTVGHDDECVFASANYEAITTDNWSSIEGALPTTLYIMIGWYMLGAILVWYLENTMLVSHEPAEDGVSVHEKATGVVMARRSRQRVRVYSMRVFPKKRRHWFRKTPRRRGRTPENREHEEQRRRAAHPYCQHAQVFPQMERTERRCSPVRLLWRQR